MQQHTNSTCIYISQLIRYSRACGSYRISLLEACCYQESYWTNDSYWLSWNHHFESFTIATITWLTVTEYQCHKLMTTHIFRLSFVIITQFFPHLLLIIGCVTERVTRRVSQVEQELLTFLEHLSTIPVFGGGSYCSIFSGIRATRSLVLCVCFGNRCLSFCTFSFGHCIVCSSSIYGFWLPLWCL